MSIKKQLMAKASEFIKDDRPLHNYRVGDLVTLEHDFLMSINPDYKQYKAIIISMDNSDKMNPLFRVVIKGDGHLTTCDIEGIQSKLKNYWEVDDLLDQWMEEIGVEKV